MNKPLHVALIWHMHQPQYKDPLAGSYAAPWVRLHAARDYLRMAEMIADYPDVRLTVNIVPGLADQLLDYASGKGCDCHLALSRQSTWTAEEKQRILAGFFHVSREGVIDRSHRYTQLLHLRDLARNEASLLSDEYYRDLIALFNLAWLSSRRINEDAALSHLVERGRGFSTEDIRTILDAQEDMMRRVIPAYRHLQLSGQIELTTSPYYHPILPLLYDMAVAQEVAPGLTLPRQPLSCPEDAREQLRQAVKTHQAHFDRMPRGLWPPEGAVSQAMLPDVVEAGFSWLASDENVLARSLGIDMGRDEDGHLTCPEVLYRPYRMDTGGQSLSLVFRDRTLSDQIGFAYRHIDAGRAVDDMMGRLRVIRERLRSSPEEHLVTIVLDGENCWDAYEANGDVFLNHLYRALSSDRGLRTVTVGEFLDEHPATSSLPHLAAGTWVPAGFETWIGQPAQNQAWDLLARMRSHLVQWSESAARSGNGAARERAWEHFYAAQGSDWFWWYFQSNQLEGKNPYHDLFLSHLQAMYRITGASEPGEADAFARTEAPVDCFG